MGNEEASEPTNKHVIDVMKEWYESPNLAYRLMGERFAPKTMHWLPNAQLQAFYHQQCVAYQEVVANGGKLTIGQLEQSLMNFSTES